jgi:hypothetical protein
MDDAFEDHLVKVSRLHASRKERVNVLPKLNSNNFSQPGHHVSHRTFDTQQQKDVLVAA